ncbi:PTS transporter subunit EIIB [Lapidilactobacillus gannanensis]|uniref:PTS transporter subunit EIIB n=1 Tax=Lapidilactobacillus gannanensis TaxID=2486002 RepID=A0ABW4BJE1_9LACO|nr:PTS glucose/sucrose transporter subunit IIB [Lapidilactobacillus gannanensis]
MKQDLKQQAHQIIDALGSPQNIKLMTHCLTRIRIAVLDRNQVNQAALKEISSISGVVSAQGQLQLVVGPALVNPLYRYLQ